MQFMLQAFYGADRSDPNNYALKEDLIESYLNASTNSFLSVVGILYSLVVAQIFLLTNEKFKKVG